MSDYDARRVRPRGLEIRRRRHEQGWSLRDLVESIAAAQRRATGLRATLTPSVIRGMEEENEAVPYRTLCLVADGLACDPADLLGEELERA